MEMQNTPTINHEEENEADSLSIVAPIHTRT